MTVHDYVCKIHAHQWYIRALEVLQHQFTNVNCDSRVSHRITVIANFPLFVKLGGGLSPHSTWGSCAFMRHVKGQKSLDQGQPSLAQPSQVLGNRKNTVSELCNMLNGQIAPRSHAHMVASPSLDWKFCSSSQICFHAAPSPLLA